VGVSRDGADRDIESREEMTTMNMDYNHVVNTAEAFCANTDCDEHCGECQLGRFLIMLKLHYAS
jgi:K+-transporting ATPase A subunit